MLHHGRTVTLNNPTKNNRGVISVPERNTKLYPSSCDKVCDTPHSNSSSAKPLVSRKLTPTPRPLSSRHPLSLSRPRTETAGSGSTFRCRFLRQRPRSDERATKGETNKQTSESVKKDNTSFDKQLVSASNKTVVTLVLRFSLGFPQELAFLRASSLLIHLHAIYRCRSRGDT